MTGSFEDRERQFEVQFAHDQEIKFRIGAHRDKLFAAWATEQLGKSAPPNYAETLATFAFGRQADELIARVIADLHAHGVAIADTKIRRAYDMSTETSRREVIDEVVPPKA